MKPATFRCRSAAKVNLTLDILGTRPNGYHELRSIVHTVGLWDELTFDFDAPWGLECNWPELAGDDNLCLRAGRLYCEVANLDPRSHSAHIALTKTIPAGAGLGGGSGNAAATLKAFNHYYEALDTITLREIAARLGADVPLFLDGGCLLMEGIGERLTPLPALDGWLLIVQPIQPGYTAAVYREWDRLHAQTPLESRKASGETAQALFLPHSNSEDKFIFLTRMAKALHNELRSAAEICGVPATALESLLLQCGALGATMTGSGSAVFGLFADEDGAQQGLAKLKRASPLHLVMQHTFVVPFCKQAIEFDVSMKLSLSDSDGRNL